MGVKFIALNLVGLEVGWLRYLLAIVHMRYDSVEQLLNNGVISLNDMRYEFSGSSDKATKQKVSEEYIEGEEDYAQFIY